MSVDSSKTLTKAGKKKEGCVGNPAKYYYPEQENLPAKALLMMLSAEIPLQLRTSTTVNKQERKPGTFSVNVTFR